MTKLKYLCSRIYILTTTAALTMAVVLLMFVTFFIKADAGTIYDSPYVTFSPDGKAWTTNAGDTDYTWYSSDTVVNTGRGSGLAELSAGQHYYSYGRTGEIYVSKWVLKHRMGACTHNSYPSQASKWHNIDFGRSPCFGYYYSGWTAYCADCGEEISDMLFYMSKEAAATIDVLEVGKNIDYYYLCPWCDNLEQGRGIATHECKAVSSNQYKVRYDANAFPIYAGFMTDSRHIYNNASSYDGKTVTASTHLSLNKYSRPGYEFIGWNTMPDGSGTSYGDGEEILNLTDYDCNIDGSKGIVTLYAMWKISESTLVINPAGGTYSGSSQPVRIAGQYLSEYDVSSEKISAPSGYTVYFSTGTSISTDPVTGTMHFTGWSRIGDFQGNFDGNKYRFTADDGHEDTIMADYERDAIVLPDIKRDGWSFGGWYYDTEFNMPAGNAGDTIIPDKDMTLYAQWIELKLFSQVNFTDNDGKGAVNLSWQQPDQKEKTYKIYQRKEGIAEWSLITGCNDIGNSRSAEKNFTYNTEQQTYTVPYTGLYTISANGASGGSYGDYKGGQGGSVSGKFWMYAGETVTVTTGGSDGSNGGGSGTMYAGGGGYTSVSTSLKGTILVAGGGGGASIMGDGKAGGSNEKLVSDTSAGESGAAGGGGGYKGGSAGEHIVHRHTTACYSNTEINVLNSYSASNYEEYDDDDDQRKCTQYGSRTNPISVNGNNKVKIDVSLQDQGTIEGEIYLYDQDGNLIGSYIKNKNDINSEWGYRYRYYCRAKAEHCIWSGDSDYDDEEGWIDGGTTAWYDGPFEDGSYKFTIRTWTEDGDGNYIYTTRRCTGHDEDGECIFTQISDFEVKAFPGYIAADDTALGYRMAQTYWPDMEVTFESGSHYWSWYYGRLIHEFDIPEGTTGIYIKVVGAKHPWAQFPAVTTLKLTGGITLSCGYTDGQVISSQPAYGGSNYINTSYTKSYENKAGVNEGNGSANISSEQIGFLDVLSLNGVKAQDYGSPEAVLQTSVVITAAGDSKVRLEWREPQDTGTVYYHMAESYSAESTQLICQSNITADTIVTGIKGYYILTDDRSDTVVTDQNGNFQSTESTVVSVGESTKYVHIAAVDNAGNISGTTHVTVNPAENVAWNLYTTPLRMEDGTNVYRKNDETNTYYVRSDGVTPFGIDYESYMAGTASDNYKINYAIFESECLGENGENRVILSDTGSMSYGNIGSDKIRTESVGKTSLSNYTYTTAARNNNCRTLSVTQKFVLENDSDGKRITVIPRAGAVMKNKSGQIYYSDKNTDADNKVIVIGDGTGPEISGIDELEDMALIDRDEGNFIIECHADDALSGLKEFYIKIVNLDNVCENVWQSDSSGAIKVDVTRDEPIFSGDFNIYVYASDNVGNVTEYSFGTTEFALNASVQRILSPHEPAFQTGESGILSISAWGYVDRVEVIFPENMTQLNPDLNCTYDYTDLPMYRHDEKLQFMVPLYTPEGDGYEITVRAYKGDKMIEEHPRISVVGVQGTVLDDVRTRLR